MLNKRNIPSAASYLLSFKTHWQLALIFAATLLLITVAATFVHPPWVNSQGGGPAVTLVGPPHNTWINTNPTFTAQVSSPGDYQNYFALFSSIAVKDDAPRFAYVDQDDASTDKDILFARCTDRTCSTIFKNPIENGPDLGTYPKIALDNSGFAMVVYSVSDGSGNYRIMYAHCTDEDCANPPTITTIATLNSQTSWPTPAIARGTDGTARIAYHTKTTDQVLIIRCNNLDCTNRTGPNVLYTYGGGSQPDKVRISMEVNTNNIPKTALLSDGRLQIVVCSDADCSSATSRRLNNKESVNLYVSMALNYSGCAGGCPQIAFRLGGPGAGPQGLFFTSCSTPDCSSSSESEPFAGMYNAFAPSVQVHPSGTPRFTFHGKGGGGAIDTGLFYARCTIANCTTYSPNPPNKVTNPQSNFNVVNSAVALDSNGYALIATYYPHSSDGAFVDRGAELGYFYCNDDPCSSPNWVSIDNRGLGVGNGPNVWAEFNWQCPSGHTCLPDAGATNPAVPIDTAGSVVSGGGPGNSTHTWSPALDDGIYDWRAKAVDANSAESAYTPGFWRVKKDTLDPWVTCSVTSSSTDITVTFDSGDTDPVPTATTSGVAVISGKLRRSINGAPDVEIPGFFSTNGTFSDTGTIGDTYEYFFLVSDNAGNDSNGGKYSSCGETTLREPGWIKTTGSDVGALGNINMPLKILVPATNVGKYSSIAVGNDDNPVIAYVDHTNYDLKVVKCNDPACVGEDETISVVDGASNSVGTHTDIVIGTSGNPIISYGGSAESITKVVMCGNPSCSTGNTITTVENVRGEFTSIAIGADGLPVISYHDLNGWDLKVAKCTGDGADADAIDCSSGTPDPNPEWVVTTIEAVPSGANGTSIAICTAPGCPDNNPVVSYNDVTSGTYSLKVLKCGSLDCSSGNTITTVDSGPPGGIGEFNSIAIGADNLPVISYEGYSGNQDLKVAKCGNPACSSGNTITGCPDNNPVVSYYNLGTNDLMVAKCGSLDCSSGNVISSVDSSAAGKYTSIAIGADFYPVISYHNNNIGELDLKVAKCDDTGCVNPGEVTTTLDGQEIPDKTPNSDYLVIANSNINNFYSAKDWLVENYSSSGGINTDFTAGSEFDELWDRFGSSKATDWGTDGEIPSNPDNLGVYAYPSIDAINSSSAIPPEVVPFNWDGAGASTTDYHKRKP
jgi:hypothetical protein